MHYERLSSLPGLYSRDARSISSPAVTTKNASRRAKLTLVMNHDVRTMKGNFRPADLLIPWMARKTDV